VLSQGDATRLSFLRLASSPEYPPLRAVVADRDAQRLLLSKIKMEEYTNWCAMVKSRGEREIFSLRKRQ
jgi:hypothetical protein